MYYGSDGAEEVLALVPTATTAQPVGLHHPSVARDRLHLQPTPTLCVNSSMRRRALTFIEMVLLALWVVLGYARPWLGWPSFIARAESNGSIEVQTWAPLWNRDIIDHVEAFRVNRPGDLPELVSRAYYARGVRHDGHFWLVLPEDKQGGGQFYLVATLRGGKLAPRQDITKVINEYEPLQFPYFAASIPLFLLAVALIVAGQCSPRAIAVEFREAVTLEELVAA